MWFQKGTRTNVLSAEERRRAIGSSAQLSSVVSECTAGVRQSWTPLTGALTVTTKTLGKLIKFNRDKLIRINTLTLPCASWFIFFLAGESGKQIVVPTY